MAGNEALIEGLSASLARDQTYSRFEKAEPYPYVKACCEKFMVGKKVSRLVAGSESTRVEEVAGVVR